MTNLIHCPFCGNKPKTMLSKKKYCQLHGDPYQDYIIKCCVVHIEEGTKESAIEKWNKRSDSAAAL